MISVVIPTLNAAQTLAQALSALVPGAVSQLVREALIADAGSVDETLEIADDAGALIVKGGLAAACAAAKGPWLLLLPADVRLGPEWEVAARDHIDHHPNEAGWFRLALDDHRPLARLKEAMAAFGPPARQGLLLSKRLYDAVSGDDAATVVRKLGGRRLRPLPARAFHLSRYSSPPRHPRA
jgi:glycosyltransferase involved in cell wall biosynthesis